MSLEKTQFQGVLVCVICTLFFTYEFFLRTIIGSFQTDLMSDMHLTSMNFSLLSSTVFLIIYGLMQVPVGIITEHIGLKKSLLIGATTCVISCLGIAQTQGFIAALFWRACMGFGASFGFICLLISINQWLPRKYNAAFIGIFQFIGTLGPMFAAGPITSIITETNISWRDTFSILATIGVAIATLIAIFVKNNSRKKGSFIILNRVSLNSKEIFGIFKSPQPWIIAAFSALIYFSLEYLSENEGRALLMAKGVTTIQASYMISISWLGYAFGAPLLGTLSDMTERRTTLMKLSAILALTAFFIIKTYTHINVLQFGFFSLGFAASGQTIAFAIMAEQFKPQFVAIGYGLNNAVILIFSSALSPALGRMLDTLSTNSTPTLEEYNSLFLFFLGMGALTIGVSCLIKETFNKKTVGFTILSRNKFRSSIASGFFPNINQH